MRRPRRWASEAARLSDAEGYAAAVSLSREADMPRVTRGILRLQPGEYANALFLLHQRMRGISVDQAEF